MALVAGLLTGCGAAGDSEQSSGTSADGAGQRADKGDAGERVASGGTIGAEGSPCELPVTFDIAAQWTAESVSGPGKDAPEDLADMMWRQGPVTAACEVDAKPAGHIGFLRVWTGEPGAADARTVLEGFVGADTGAGEEKYRRFEAGGLVGAEVEYRYTSELTEDTKTEHALAVVTPAGPVVLHLGGLDTAEHEAMLPAYELAKRTLRAS
ncbi:lipoprotein [Streptomyces sp. NPDC089424]|uniref:lipoprotein n=1 Tax=Streptomyces sp. NPDC089424 TaxID=3365917 RepID=UPI0037F4F766